jgi:hypothetical protein
MRTRAHNYLRAKNHGRVKMSKQEFALCRVTFSINPLMSAVECSSGCAMQQQLRGRGQGDAA